MKTAMEVGGDYYDFIWNEEEGEIKVALGDAAGHGLLAAMIVSNVRSYFQANANTMESPALLKLISDGLYGLNMRVALMGLAILRIRNRTVQITSAGMPPILIWRHRLRRIEEVTIKSIFLGSAFDVTYDTLQFTLEPDDVLLACSDGVMEARNENAELFGLARLSTIFATMAEEPAQVLVSEVFEAVNQWIGNKPPADDISLLAIRVK
jgi:sigma-B regulation protein RsbU (phosphoserine phosphatase)